jgi:dTDP-3-amino-3,4,6-trideoxy-alpha-D-glucose transaminase
MGRLTDRHAPTAIGVADPHAGYRELQVALDAASRRVLDSGAYIFGDEVAAFEGEYADYCGASHAIGVGNGLDALSLALRAAGIGPGDEVIVPAHTFIATWLAVIQTGADVVPVDVEEDTLLLDVAAARAAVGPRTAAILPVHLYGHPVDMDAVDALAAPAGLFVLEDAAQAHGARCRGRRAGSLGRAAGFSFYPGKNLGAFGDGGAVTTADGDLADRVRRLGNYGSSAKYVHDEPGCNSRLDALQAAFLRVKLEALEDWNARRTAVAERYLAQLGDVPGLVLPVTRPWADPVWHLFAVRHPERDALGAHLGQQGVSTLVHYPTPPHLTPAFAGLGHGVGAFPVAERAASTLLSLPIGPHLRASEVEQVIDAICSFEEDAAADAGRAAARAA